MQCSPEGGHPLHPGLSRQFIQPIAHTENIHCSSTHKPSSRDTELNQRLPLPSRSYGAGGGEDKQVDQQFQNSMIDAVLEIENTEEMVKELQINKRKNKNQRPNRKRDRGCRQHFVERESRMVNCELMFSLFPNQRNQVKTIYWYLMRISLHKPCMIQQATPGYISQGESCHRVTKKHIQGCLSWPNLWQQDVGNVDSHHLGGKYKLNGVDTQTEIVQSKNQIYRQYHG